MTTSPGNVNSEYSPTMQQAMDLMRAGKGAQAEEIVARRAEQIRHQFGAGSAEDATTQGELGAVLTMTGQLDRAINAYQEACKGPTDTEPLMRDRLTNLMTLGQLLDRVGRLDEAEKVLFDGLKGRESFYGREHPGYAFGLEPLAELMLRTGHIDTAMDMVQEVVWNFGRNGHPRLAGAVVLRALVMKELGKGEAPFAILEKLPTEFAQDVAARAVDRAARSDNPRVASQMLQELVDPLSAKLGDAHSSVLNVLISISNVERNAGKDRDSAARISVIQKVIAIFEKQGKPREVINGLLGLALAHSDAGDNEQALSIYWDAADRASKLGDRGLASQIHRNCALLLSEMGRSADAEKMLKDAVDEARQVSNSELLGRALIALGIFLQHQNRLTEAQPLLKEGQTHLPPTDPDSITAGSHLRAIETGGGCGCGDTGAAIAQAFHGFVMARLPADLLSRLDVELKEGDFEVGVHLQREPKPEEVAHLERTINHALTEFRQKLLSRT